MIKCLEGARTPNSSVVDNFHDNYLMLNSEDSVSLDSIIIKCILIILFVSSIASNADNLLNPSAHLSQYSCFNVALTANDSHYSRFLAKHSTQIGYCTSGEEEISI